MCHLLACLSVLALTTLASAQAAVARGTYSAHVEVRIGSCCSASCAAISTLTDVTLTLAADGSARLRWARTGCGVTISGAGPMRMPRDPGPPAAVCAMRGPGAEPRTYDDEVTQRGTWRSESADALVTLDGGTTLRCTPATVDGLALIACTIDAASLDTTGLTLDGHVYLDRRAGLVERLDATERVSLDRRSPRRRARADSDETPTQPE